MCCVFPLQSELTNLQWQDVQNRLIEVQKVHQMCVHKEELTELGWFVFVRVYAILTTGTIFFLLFL